ncbi:MAG: DnaD domain protein [Clostridia bacterium]|nr:DnaD domain protein [Clostridia bacterium]
MAFCSFTTEGVKSLSTSIDNSFITDYLIEADGAAVKVYLYGLFLCKNGSDAIDFTKFCTNLGMEESTVKDCFRYWEEFDCVSIIAEEPFTVKYLPLSKTGKPRKFKAGKYDEFNKSLQSLITERMISTNEYADYFSVMEDYSIKPEAMLMICKYCVDLKGPSIGGKYIYAVAKDFAMRGITTVDTIEIELADYLTKSSDIQKVLTALSIKRKADVEDLNYYNKWVKELGFEHSVIVFIAKATKAKSVLKLDEVITELYGAKVYSEKEVASYLVRKSEVIELAKSLTRELSVYCEVIKPVIDNYVNPWLALGFNGETLTFLANYCFKKRKKSLEEMNDVVNSLYKKGLISLFDIADYFKLKAKDDEFIKQLLDMTGTNRQPNEWDRKNLASWRNWGFSDEMIISAAEISGGRSNPMIYMNSVLGNWKAKGIFVKEDIPATVRQSGGDTSKMSHHFANERTYTKEELDKLIVDIETVDFD